MVSLKEGGARQGRARSIHPPLMAIATTPRVSYLRWQEKQPVLAPPLKPIPNSLSFEEEIVERVEVDVDSYGCT